ncbi:MAG TPA: hypothetical protein VFH68_04840 [Polyangia bacterium]|jgi:hypothetical protein|nr:hypothetical protein [Polyangia bacterium]
MRTTIEDSLSSSDARDAILSRHDQLRGLVSETIHFAEGATRSDREFEPLRAQARELYEAFEEHMDFEEELLATALRDVIGVGDILQAQMQQGHAKQRATLASAISALEPGGLSRARVVESVRAFVDALLRELNSEERCLLHADLDAIATDSQGG